MAYLKDLFRFLLDELLAPPAATDACSDGYCEDLEEDYGHSSSEEPRYRPLMNVDGTPMANEHVDVWGNAYGAPAYDHGSSFDSFSSHDPGGFNSDWT